MERQEPYHSSTAQGDPSRAAADRFPPSPQSTHWPYGVDERHWGKQAALSLVKLTTDAEARAFCSLLR